MKILSRLTALLLTFAMLTTSTAGAFAETALYDLDLEQYEGMVSSAQQAAEEAAAADAQEESAQSGVVSIVEGGEVYTRDTAAQTSRFEIYEDVQNLSFALGETKSVTLPQSGKINLTVDGAEKWQIYVPGADIWVDISGADGSDFALTYASVGGMLSGGSAKVRAVAGEAYTEVGVAVAYGSVYADEIAADAAEETAETAQASTFAMARAADEAGVMPAAEGQYTITINYLFADGSQAASPWVATVTAGTDFFQNVSSPIVTGYMPSDNQSIVTVNETAIDEDIVYTVYYVPAPVGFTVLHYQQNLNDDNYALVGTENKRGDTGSAVGEDLAMTYPGFYALLYDTTTEIAADGSTQIEIYYDRNYYLMSFDLDGGYGTEPIYARYEADLGTIPNPTRAGYTFLGWTLDGNTIVELPTTMPYENRTYIAKWEMEDTAKVTVVFWGETADCTDEDKEYAYLGSGTLDADVGVEFTYNNEETTFYTCGQEAHTHSETCEYNCGQEVHTHTLEDCYTLTCTIEPHNHTAEGCALGNCTHTAHTLDCYSAGRATLTATTQPNQQMTHTGNNIYTYTTTEETFWGDTYTQTHYYLRLNEQWYCASYSTMFGDYQDDTQAITLTCNHAHSDACYTCGMTTNNHVHSVEEGCYELKCTKEEHTHFELCFSCGKTAHTHTADCRQEGSGLDPDLWTLVKSDTVTVAPDGSTVVNVYYDRTEFTLTFYDDDNQVYQIKEKWGADISEHWPIKGTNGTTYDDGQRWDPYGSDTYNQVLVYLAIMPAESFSLYLDTSNEDTYIMHYMVEALPGTTGTTSYNGREFIQDFEVEANYNFITRDEDFFDLDGFTQWASNPAFGTNGRIDIGGGGDVYFYYTRNSYTLDFNNGYSVVRSESVQYEAPLSTYETYEPDPPYYYESGSVDFAGWYLNPECTGEEFDLNEHTMPASDLLLYAKWVPKTYNVNIYLTSEKANQIGQTQVVSHGSTAVEPEEESVVHPESENYKFVGWFYMDGDTEKAFDFSMPVTKDMDIYAKWSTNTLVKYTIKYAIKGEDGSYTYIAPDSTGYALAGTGKTFTAKAGEELNEGYKTGFYPTTNSHYVPMLIDEANEYTFIYEAKAEVGYTVKYLEAGTNVVLHEEKTALTRDAVITETFEPVTGYMPDAYQKRLVLSATESENVIIFWYVQDTEHAPVQIIHYTQNAVGDGYTIYQESTDLNGLIGQAYSTDVLTIYGFTFDHATANSTPVTDVNGKVTETVTASGLILELYYDRNEYPYAFNFLEQGTDKVLADPETGEARYGAQVTQTAKDILGYTLVSEEETQAMIIQVEDGDVDYAVKNVRYFYYTENQVTINYVPVGPAGADDFGTVAPESETVKVLTGTANGSTPTAGENYKFVGWYLDEDCTTPVPEEQVVNNHFTPAQNDDGVYETATYYAKFELDKGYLHITKNGMSEGENAIFTVSGPGYEGKVVVANGETVTLFVTCGEYTITENGGWTGRYTAQTSQTATADADGETVTFTNTKNITKWLDGEDREINDFK